MTRRIYVASSWKNIYHQGVVAALVAMHGKDAVYDYRNPKVGEDGFAWQQIDPLWQQWTPEMYVNVLDVHPRARESFKFDMDALNWCNTCVLVLPSGNSAHIEAGHAIGAHKDLFILLSPKQEDLRPDLMYRMATRVCLSLPELLKVCDA